jgi:hypothetical protein
MPLWNRLYMTIWLLMFEFLLSAHLFNTIVITALHVLLAGVVIVVTRGNARLLAAEPVPARLKRISASTASLAIAQLVIGLIVGVLRHAPVPKVLATIVTPFHVIVALAMITQAASVATAHDMRDEQELVDGPNRDAPPSSGKPKSS